MPTLADNIMLNSGDVVRIESAGGGGWGNPLERDLDDVARDVKKGYVTIEGARRDYGVVMDSDTLTVDTEATRAFRATFPVGG